MTRRAAQEALKSLMSDISERCYYAGWMFGTEFVLWQALVEGPRTWGHGTITEEDIATLNDLAQRTGGWIAWDESTEETFLPMPKWLELYSAHREAT